MLGIFIAYFCVLFYLSKEDSKSEKNYMNLSLLIAILLNLIFFG